MGANLETMDGGMGWVGSVEVIGVAKGHRTEGTIGHGACSQLAGGGLKQMRERGTETEEREREKKEVKTRSVYTKKCSASDSRTG